MTSPLDPTPFSDLSLHQGSFDMTHPEVIFSMRTCRLFGSDGRPIPHDEGISWGSIWHIPAHTNRVGAQSGGGIFLVIGRGATLP